MSRIDWNNEPLLRGGVDLGNQQYYAETYGAKYMVAIVKRTRNQARIVTRPIKHSPEIKYRRVSDPRAVEGYKFDWVYPAQGADRDLCNFILSQNEHIYNTSIVHTMCNITGHRKVCCQWGTFYVPAWVTDKREMINMICTMYDPTESKRPKSFFSYSVDPHIVLPKKGRVCVAPLNHKF